MAIDAAVLQQERTRLQAEVSGLDTKIATLGGEIKAHLEALGINESEVEVATTNTQKALSAAEDEFNKVYAEYEAFKAQQLQDASDAQQGFTSSVNA